MPTGQKLVEARGRCATTAPTEDLFWVLSLRGCDARAALRAESRLAGFARIGIVHNGRNMVVGDVCRVPVREFKETDRARGMTGLGKQSQTWREWGIWIGECGACRAKQMGRHAEQ